MSAPDVPEAIIDLSLDPDDDTVMPTPVQADDFVDTDRMKALTNKQVAEHSGEWDVDDTPSSNTVPASPAMAPAAVLRGWTRAEGPDMAAVAAVLSGPYPAVDLFLAEGAEAREFGRALLSGEVYDLGAATEEGRTIPRARWVALARTAPEAFVWHVPPPYVLPVEPEPLRREFEEELLPWVERADLRVTLTWLGTPGFLDDADATDRIEDLVRAQAPVVGWAQAVDGLEAMIRRGGKWRAARTLERLLRQLRPDRDEANTIQRVARKCMDAQLFARMAAVMPWRGDDALLADLADRIPTDSLLVGFLDDDVVRRAHLRGEAADRVLRTAWRALSGRNDRAALEAAARLVMQEARKKRNAALSLEMLEAVAEAHGARSVEVLTAVFLSGIHRTEPGEAIERILLEHPEAALLAALSELPEWVPGFDPSSMERLAWRLVPRIDAAARERVRDAAEFTGGVPGRRVLDELG